MRKSIMMTIAISYLILASSVIGLLHIGQKVAFASTFPGKNGKIAFTSYRTFSNQIWIMNPDGTGQRKLTTGDGSGDPNWSPDGTKIAYVMTLCNPQASNSTNPNAPNANECQSVINIMKSDGTNQEPAFGQTAEMDRYEPSWSPDGKTIVFVGSTRSETHIYKVPLGGSNIDVTDIATLSSGYGSFEVLPTWSPDGSKIAYADWWLQGSLIWIMNPDGTDKVPLNNPGIATRYESEPNWSPDGTEIAFVRGNDDPFCGEIWVLSGGGGHLTQLTNPPNNTCDSNPRFSPDGTKIVFGEVSQSGDSNIFVMNTDGSNKIQLTNSNSDYSADLQPWACTTGYTCLPPVWLIPGYTYTTNISICFSCKFLLEVAGSGWAPHSSINILFDKTIIFNDTTNATGYFVRTFPLPENLTVGSHIVKVTDVMGNIATATFTAIKSIPEFGSLAGVIIAISIIGVIIITRRLRFLSFSK